MENKNTNIMDAAKEMAKNALAETKNEVVEAKEDIKHSRPCGFVKYSFSAADAFARREAVKECNDIIGSVIASTGGNMPTELIDAYEGLHQIMEHIKRVELDVIRVGR